MTSALSRKIQLDHEHIVLALQGGGALGAYQAGVFEELCVLPAEPHWVVGVSIGAINAALIAGNAPENRLARLTEFWQTVSSGPVRGTPFGGAQRGAFNQWSAAWAALFGVPGFYRPRIPPPMFQADGTPGAISVYDASDLRATLERLVDFDRINARTDAGWMRLSVGAVNVATGNSVYFDNTRHRIGPEHIMASGALPPAFAPVVIDGESFWDGGIVSNTPLQYVLDERARDRNDKKLMVVQVDLFSARGAVPVDLPGVLQRHKDLIYSSRSRYSTAKVAELQRTRRAMRRLIERLPAPLRDDPDVRRLAATLHAAPVDIVHLIYRQNAYESESKDYEFSRASVEEHWAAGRRDMRRTREHPDWLTHSSLDEDVTVYDLGQGFDAAPGAADRGADKAIEKAEAALETHARAIPTPAKRTRASKNSASNHKE